MSVKRLIYFSSLIAVPVLYLAYYAVHVSAQGKPLESSLRWDALLLLASMMLLEQFYGFRNPGSQRFVLTRDIVANVVNKYVTGALTAVLLLPLLQYIPAHILGRKAFIASPDQLGPFWFQVLVILLAVSLFRYWMHRFQHSNEFLWSLHSYHHRVTDLRALNTDVSNPVDFALRNVVVFLILGVIGFNPLAILLTVPATNVSASISHWGADVKAGLLNYVFVTPEVHRWHHTAEVPEGHKYSVNYGVEFAFWDILFGTYHLPHKNGEYLQPARIGHPSGLPDEPNYWKLLLLPFGLYPPSWFKRTPQPAE